MGAKHDFSLPFGLGPPFDTLFGREWAFLNSTYYGYNGLLGACPHSEAMKGWCYMINEPILNDNVVVFWRFSNYLGLTR